MYVKKPLDPRMYALLAKTVRSNERNDEMQDPANATDQRNLDIQVIMHRAANLQKFMGAAGQHKFNIGDVVRIKPHIFATLDKEAPAKKFTNANSLFVVVFEHPSAAHYTLVTAEFGVMGSYFEVTLPWYMLELILPEQDPQLAIDLPAPQN